MKVLIAAPFELNGRYRGGITLVVEGIFATEDLCRDKGVELAKFNTCRINRSVESSAKLNLINILNFLKIYKDLPKTVKKEKADALYYHSSIKLALLKDLLAIRKAKKKTGVKTVVHIHFAEYCKIMTGKKFIDTLILRLFKYVDKIVFLSSKTSQEFIEKGISKEKCAVVYNFSNLKFEKQEIENKLQTEIKIPKFLFVGSIDKRKGLFDTLNALNDFDKPYEIHVCGAFSSSDYEALFNEYKNKMGEKLIFHGYVNGEEKRKLFLESDVLVLPSYSEGLPIVILEAMDSAMALLTSDVGAIGEIINDGGFLVNPGNIEEIKNALNVLINDSEKVKQMQNFNYNESFKYSNVEFVKQIINICK